MNFSNFRVSLDIHEMHAQRTLYVKKGDTARRIVATLTENGRPYRIAEGCTAVFTAKKPDGNCLYNLCRIAGNTIEYPFTNQTANVAGSMECELRLYGAQFELLTSPRFDIVVDDTVYSDGDIVDSSSEYSALTRLLQDTAALTEAMEKALEKDVTAEYEAWYPTAPPNARQAHHFLLTLPDGQYRLTWDGYQTYRMSRITTPVGNVLQQLYVTQEQFFYFYAYVNDDLVCELSTEEDYFQINGRRYATEEFVERRFAAVQNPAFTEIQKTTADGRKVLRVWLRGLENIDDGKLELHLWRNCRNRGRKAHWVSAAVERERRDGSGAFGYGDLAGERYMGEVNQPEYPNAPDWMPNGGYVRSVYPVYDGEGKLLPYVDVDVVNDIILPLLKPTLNNGEFTWKTCGLCGLSNRKGNLQLAFHVVRDGETAARCRSTVSVGGSKAQAAQPCHIHPKQTADKGVNILSEELFVKIS